MNSITVLSTKVTRELLEQAIEHGTQASLLVRVAGVAATSPKFAETINACVEGAKMSRYTMSPTEAHHLAKTALIGGIQLGIVMALLAEEESRKEFERRE
jgi:hypothetical protein